MGLATMLWGHSIESWEAFGIKLMWAALGLTVLLAGVSFSSSYILWKVGKAAQEPRSLDAAQIASLSEAVAGFEAQRVVLGAVPSSKNNADLADQILTALKAAKVDAFI